MHFFPTESDLSEIEKELKELREQRMNLDGLIWQLEQQKEAIISKNFNQLIQRANQHL